FARFTVDDLRADPRRDVRRYLPLMPVDPQGPLTPLTVGWTPLVNARRLAKDLGVRQLWLKDDSRNPTGSFKDRASFVGVARAAAGRHTVVAAASTGNAATSLAGLAASMGLVSHIFVPATAPEAKVTQLLIYGAKVFLIDADYDTTYDICQQAVARFGWYDRSAAANPYLVEGKKTCGLEIAEQLQDDLPDWVVMSVGDGCSLAGTYKGLAEMKRMGLVDRVPRMLAVQAEGAAPLTAAFKAGTEDVARIEARTCADSINVGMPRNPLKALRAVRDSGGAFVNVSDEAILDFIPRTARGSGVFGEPAAVTAVASGCRSTRASTAARSEVGSASERAPTQRWASVAASSGVSQARSSTGTSGCSRALARRVW
ncbi:MAG: threonine synthase, partial [Myxococcales bacterium]|nr:threonine synthase [Myxococcales bacterium]